MILAPLFWVYLVFLFLIFIFLTNRISFHPPCGWGEAYWTLSWSTVFISIQTFLSVLFLKQWDFTWAGLSLQSPSSIIYMGVVVSWVGWMVLDHFTWKFFRLKPLLVKKTKVEKIKVDKKFVAPFGFLKRLGMENQLYQPQVTEYEVKLEGWPKEFSGLTIVHISDLHYGKYLSNDYLKAILKKAKELKPDLFALTGDFINFKKDIPAMCGLLKGFKAPLGVYAVLGNHDHGADPIGLTQALKEDGVRVLDHEVVYHSRKGKKLAVMGAAELWFGNRDESAIRNAKADAKILLAHHPDHFYLGKASGAHLQISGHCHGGQICFPFIGPLIVPSNQGRKYAGGFYHEKNTVLFVTNGIGCYPPLRLLCPPEIVKLVLKPA
jgi:predicted MPP superfamily phosphohydrolase